MSAPGVTVDQGARRDPEGLDLGAVALATVVIGTAVSAGIVAADTPILAVAIASLGLLATAMVLRPDVATLVSVAILYSNAAVVLVRFHGVPAFVAAVVPLLLVVPLARDLIVRREPIVAPPVLRWMVVFLFINLISALQSSDLQTSWDAITTFLIEGIGLYFLLLNVIRTPDMLRATTWALLGAGAIIAALSVHQAITSNYGSDYFGFAQATSDAGSTGVTTLTGTDLVAPRLSGSIGETNRFAQTMLMLVPLGIFRFIDERSVLLRFIAAVSTALITLAVVFTFSRGAAVGLGVLVLALMALRLIQSRHVIAIVVVLALVLVAFPRYADRISSLAAVTSVSADAGTGAVDNSLLSRVTETLSAGLVMVDHPLLGVGPDMFPIYYQQYAEVIGILVKNGAQREAHNLYLGVGAELGVIGLVVFLIIAYLTVRMLFVARKRARYRRPDLERLTTPFLLALMTYYVTGMFLHLSFARFYWMMLAIAGAAAVITLRETSAAATETQAPAAWSMGSLASRPDATAAAPGGAARPYGASSQSV
jgi:putative inorganic carbon (hco3(-)) transporter